MNYLKVISKTAFFFMEAARKAEEMESFSEKVHTTPSADADIQSMWEVIITNNVATDWG